MSNVSERLKTALSEHYTIERELGVGGMATVYAARDLRHDRVVALKVLKPEIAATLGAERFLLEIRVAAKLNHPHILPLLDSGTAEEQPTAVLPNRRTAFLYYTMPIVEGESLRARLNREGQLGVDAIRGLAKDVGAALDYAHNQGVIHRDIKPENILYHHGEPMVADFGIALAVKEAGGERLTETGISVGTPQYMSPEQVSGDRQLDARSDVYALGCVLYEALVGEPPFTGPSAMAVMARQVTDPVRPIATVRPDVPAHLVSAVNRALAKVPADRFDSAGHLAIALATPEPAPAQEQAPSVVKSGAPPRRTIAVLPFANMSADPENEYFSDGITDDVMSQLSKVGELKVISRTSTARFRDTDLSLREIGEQLNADVILEGTVRKAGSRVRIVAQLIDARDDTHVWNDTYDRMLTDVFEIQSEVAISIAEALEAELSPKERREIFKKPTDDLEAYDLYLLGRHHLNKRTVADLQKAIRYFEQAIDRDHGYARAYAGLAEVYVMAAIGYAPIPPAEAMEKAKQMASRAIELDPMGAEAHSIYGFATLTCDWDVAKAERSVLRALEIDSNYAPAHQRLAWCRIVKGDYIGGLEAWEQALEFDPLSAVLITESGWPFSYVGLHDLALERCKLALEIQPEFALAINNVAWNSQASGRKKEAIEYHKKAIELSGGAPFMLAFLATAYVESGQPERARQILDTLIDSANQDHGSGLSVAIAAEALGETNLALDWLERAYADREVMVSVLQIRAFLRFSSLRGHPRFESLLDHIGIPPHDVEGQRSRLLDWVRAKKRGEPAKSVVRRAAAEQKNSIAVLPFSNKSAEPENEYFSDGITEDIITQLSKIGALKVVARSSSMRYRQSDKPMLEIGAELGVDRLVQGSVRRAADRVRITAQLIDVGTDRELWAESYDRDLADVFAIQSDVARSIADALRAELTPAESARIARQPTEDMEAYREYLLGRHHWSRWTEEDFFESIRHFERAIEIDPNFAEAYGALSETWSHLGVGYWSVRPLDAYPKARDAAVRAVELDPDSAEAKAQLVMVEWWFEFAFDRALERAERATSLNPNCAPAFDYRANILTMLGRHDEALEQSKRACELDPVSIFINANYGLYLYRARRWPEAITQFQRTIDLDPNLPMGHALQALAYIEAEDLPKALEGFRRADQLSAGNHAYRVMLGYGHAAAGDREQALQILQEIEGKRSEVNVWLVMLAMGYAKLGETERALHLLEDAFRERGGWIVWLGVEPGLDGLREHPRFTALMNQLGLPAVGKAKPTPAMHVRFKVNPHTVGREIVAAELHSAFESVATTHGLVLCVSGEAGIGKTTVVENFLSELEVGEDAAVVGRGRCSERLAGAEAYLPIIEVLESAVEGDTGLASFLRSVSPGWAGQVLTTGTDSAADGTPVTSQERLKRELCSFLQDVSRNRPVVLFIEDLHWADVSTVDVLSYLADRLDTMRVLILATYRAEEMRQAEHPFLEVKLNLESRGTLREIPLGFLREEDVRRFLSLEFPGSSLDHGFAELIHRRTEGNPLFMVDLLHYLRDRSVIILSADGWRLDQSLRQVESDLPQSVRSMIQRKIDRLVEDERKLLTVASVQGYEFHGAVLSDVLDADAADIEESLQELERVHGLVTPIAEEDLPDGTFTVRYQFVHVLYQNALYDELSPTRRVSLSRSVAESLARYYGDERGRVAAELAVLFEAGRQFEQSVEFYLAAARAASAMFANHEALLFADRGLVLLERIPETPSRLQHELDLEMVRGPALIITKGYASAEVASTYDRAQELAEQVGDAKQLFAVLVGLFYYRGLHESLTAAEDIAHAIMDLVQNQLETNLYLPAAHQLLASVLCWTGNWMEGQRHAELGIQAYDRDQHGFLVQYVPQDPGEACLAFAGYSLSLQGFFDQAWARLDQALESARELNHGNSIAEALSIAACFAAETRDMSRTIEYGTELHSRGVEEGIPDRVYLANMILGRAKVLSGEIKEGIELLGAEPPFALLSSAFGSWLAHAYIADGQFGKGLEVADRSLDLVDQTGDREWEALIHCAKGDAIAAGAVAGDPTVGPEAEKHAEESYGKALEIARDQQAHYPELKAAISMCRLWQRQERIEEARELLRGVYGWFTEGFDVPELLDAKALLEELER